MDEDEIDALFPEKKEEGTPIINTKHIEIGKVVEIFKPVLPVAKKPIEIPKVKKEGVRVIQVCFDCTIITLIVEKEEDLFITLFKYDNSFFETNQGIFYKFDEDYQEKCSIKDVTDERGIIQYESH